MSNASGVPQAVTKAPGEANHNACGTCHTPAGNYNPSIALDFMTLDSTVVTMYEPGQRYIVRVKLSGINNPKSFGFQMSCLDSTTNSDMGNWSSLGDRVKLQNLTVKQKPRKYLVQSSPKADGIFVAQWQAPVENIGAVNFYFSGLAINQNGNTSGDNSVFGQKTITAPTVSSVLNDLTRLEYKVSPNPVIDVFSIDLPVISSMHIFTITGDLIYSANKISNTFDISTLKSGIYLSVFRNADNKIVHTQKIIKI